MTFLSFVSYVDMENNVLKSGGILFVNLMGDQGKKMVSFNCYLV